MRLLADLNISPRTILHLRSLGHDVVPADSLLPANAPDEAIVAMALQHDRVILTQDMDFSAIIARSRMARPSLISLRLARAGSAHVNPILERSLPYLELAVLNGVMVTIEDHRYRIRNLPV